MYPNKIYGIKMEHETIVNVAQYIHHLDHSPVIYSFALDDAGTVICSTLMSNELLLWISPVPYSGNRGLNNVVQKKYFDIRVYS